MMNITHYIYAQSSIPNTPPMLLDEFNQIDEARAFKEVYQDILGEEWKTVMVSSSAVYQLITTRKNRQERVRLLQMLNKLK